MRRGRLVLVAWMAGATGCGRLDFGDRARDAATPATVAAPRCDWRQGVAFSTAVLEPALDTGGFIRGEWFSPDALDLVYTRASPQAHVEIAPRGAVDTEFEAGTTVPELASSVIAGASFTDDNLDAMFQVDGATSNNLAESVRVSASDPWGPQVPVVGLLPVGQFGLDPWLSPDGLTLWFARTGQVSEDQDLLFTTRATRTSQWAAPTAVDELNDPGADDFHPTLDASQRLLAFASAREPPNIRVFYATRDSLTSPWSTPAAVALRPESLNQADPGMTRDGCELAFNSPPGEVDSQWATWRAVWVGP